MAMFQRGQGLRQLAESNIPSTKSAGDHSSFSSRSYLTATSKVVEEAMQRHYDEMKRKAVEDARLEKTQLEILRREAKHDRQKERRSKKKKEQLVEILRLQKEERDMSRKMERERERASHLADLSLYRDEELVQAYPPVREVPLNVKKEMKQRREQRMKEDLERQVKQKNDEIQRATIKTAEEHKRRLERLKELELEESLKQQEKKNERLELCMRQWDLEMEVRKQRKQQQKRTKEFEYERRMKEEKKVGSIPPEAYLPDRRVQAKNKLTGDVYYPRPTHASLAVRALKNRQHSSRTLSPISEPGGDTERALTRRERREEVETDESGSEGVEEGYESEFDRIDTARGGKVSPREGKKAGGGQRRKEEQREEEEADKLERYLRRKKEKKEREEEGLSRRLMEYSETDKMAKTASSNMSSGSRRFYSMEKLKAALKKSMPTGLFKKKRKQNGDEEVVSAYLFDNKRKERSVSPKRIKEMRESFSGAPQPKLLKRENYFKRHQRSHSDVMNQDDGVSDQRNGGSSIYEDQRSESSKKVSKVEREIFQRELARIQEIEQDEARILLEGEQMKHKEAAKENAYEEAQKAKRMLHNKDLKEQIKEELKKKREKEEYELTHPENEIFPKIEEPPEEETWMKHRQKLKTQQEMLEVQMKERKEFMDRALLASRGGPQGVGILAELWDKSGPRMQRREQQKVLVNEWKKEVELKRMQKAGERLAARVKEPQAVEDYFQKNKAPSGINSSELGNTPQPLLAFERSFDRKEIPENGGSSLKKRSVTAHKRPRQKVPLQLPGVMTPNTTSKYVKLNREKRVPAPLTGRVGTASKRRDEDKLQKLGAGGAGMLVGGDWRVPVVEIKPVERKSPLKLSDKQELMNKLSERIDLNPTSRQRARLNQTYDERSFSDTKTHHFVANLNNSIDAGRRFGGVSARAHQLDSARGSRRTAAQSSRMSARQQKKAGEGKTLFPWEKREVSLKQNQLFAQHR